MVTHMKKKQQMADEDTSVVSEPEEVVGNGEVVNQEDVWKDRYMRALADYRNLEKRSATVIDETRQFAAATVIEKLLPVVDMFEKAEKHLKDQGLTIAVKELHAVLASQGVEKVDVMGKKFDPTYMECVEAGKDGDDTVTDVIAPGYAIRGKLVRAALVKVGK